MKNCKSCGLDKSEEDFPFHQKSKGTRRAECSECYNKRRKEKGDPDGKRKATNNKSYQKHNVTRKKEVIEYQKANKGKVSVWRKKSVKKTKEAFAKWKATLACQTCGENHPACLEFHHLDPSQKEGLISKMRVTPNKLEEELKKCIVLCSNCHRKLHWDQNHN